VLVTLTLPSTGATVPLNATSTVLPLRNRACHQEVSIPDEETRIFHVGNQAGQSIWRETCKGGEGRELPEEAGAG